MPLPKLRIYNRQKAHAIPLPWLRRIGKAALPGCIAAIKSPDAPLASLPEIEITIVNDADIARVHGDFLDDPTPTDVITFHHGEILISADTAERQGREHGHHVDHEVALYLVHGLLHLAGWDDHEADEACEMAGRQEAVLQEALASIERKKSAKIPTQIRLIFQTGNSDATAAMVEACSVVLETRALGAAAEYSERNKN